MLKLKRNEQTRAYNGFILKADMYYGVDTESNQIVALTGWEVNGDVAVYVYEPQEQDWKRTWRDIEKEDFEIENLPNIEIKDITFNQYLKEIEGSDFYNDYVNDYSGIMAEKIEIDYRDYLYDYAPLFVQKGMEKETLLIIRSFTQKEKYSVDTYTLSKKESLKYIEAKKQEANEEGGYFLKISKNFYKLTTSEGWFEYELR
jgi:hypothetical protein